ncbi:hypothetical protein [Parasphingorhabdus sp.]|uniref:hypothetical protein n=1 Tax=Parasphingorhabdus sp. TaxID=2709688 RepID=UPI003267B491
MTIIVDPIFTLLGLGSGIAGLFILYRAWLENERSTKLLAAGWAALLGSLVFWIYAGGADRGIALGLIVICLGALCFVGHSAAQQPANQTKVARKKKPSQKPPQAASFAQWGRSIGIILFLGPICGLLAFLIAMGVYEALDMVGTERANSLVTALFLFPILWAIIVSFCLISTRRIWKAAVLLCAPLLSAALIFVGYA